MSDSAPTSPETNAAEALFANIIIQPGVATRMFWLLRRAFIAAYEDNCFGIAKGAAYSFLLSLFPILTTLTAILIQARAQSVVHVITTFAMQVVPPGTEELILDRLREKGGKPGTLPIVCNDCLLVGGIGRNAESDGRVPGRVSHSLGTAISKRAGDGNFPGFDSGRSGYWGVIADYFWGSRRSCAHPVDWVAPGK